MPPVQYQIYSYHHYSSLSNLFILTNVWSCMPNVTLFDQYCWTCWLNSVFFPLFYPIFLVEKKVRVIVNIHKFMGVYPDFVLFTYMGLSENRVPHAIHRFCNHMFPPKIAIWGSKSSIFRRSQASDWLGYLNKYIYIFHILLYIPWNPHTIPSKIPWITHKFPFKSPLNSYEILHFQTRIYNPMTILPPDCSSDALRAMRLGRSISYLKVSKHLGICYGQLSNIWNRFGDIWDLWDLFGDIWDWWDIAVCIGMEKRI
jgi:hypothetical protein